MTKAEKIRRHKRIHLVLTAAWAVMVPVAVATNWIYSVAFVSICSLYANFASHYAAYEAADD